MKFDFLNKLFFAPFTAVLLSGVISCSTPQSQALRHVDVGMTKAEVLDIAGDPARTGREHGQDRWVYVPHGDDSSNESTYVFFSEGKVTYIGPSDDPTRSGNDTAKDKNFKPVGE